MSGETIPSENVNTRLLFTSDTGSEPNLQVSPKLFFKERSSLFRSDEKFPCLTRCFVFVTIPAWVCNIWNDIADQASLPGFKDLVPLEKNHGFWYHPHVNTKYFKWNPSGNLQDIFVRSECIWPGTILFLLMKTK